MTTSSSDVAVEKQIFFTQADNKDNLEEKTLERKEQSRKCETMGSKWETILLENKCERIYNDRRKHDVKFRERNQAKCTTTSRASWRSCFEECEPEIFRPITWRKVNDDRLTIQTLQGKWRLHNSQIWRNVQEKYWRNGYCQKLQNIHPEAIS